MVQVWSSGEVANALGEPRQNITDTLRRGRMLHSGEAHARFTLPQAVAMGIARHLVVNGVDVWAAALVARNATFSLEEFVPLYLKHRKVGNILPQEQEPFVIATVRGRSQGAERGAEFEALIRPWAKVVEHRPAAAETVFLVPLIPILDRLIAGLPQRGAQA